MNTLMKQSFLFATLALVLSGCGGSSAPGASASLVEVAQAAARQSDRVNVEDCTLEVLQLDGLRIAQVRVSRGITAESEPEPIAVAPEPSENRSQEETTRNN